MGPPVWAQGWLGFGDLGPSKRSYMGPKSGPLPPLKGCCMGPWVVRVHKGSIRGPPSRDSGTMRIAAYEFLP